MSTVTAVALTILTKGSLLLLLAIVAGALWRTSSASGRHLIWMLSVFGLVLLPVGEWLLPSVDLAWLPQKAERIEESTVLGTLPDAVQWTDGPAPAGPPPTRTLPERTPFQPEQLLLWLWPVVTLGLIARGWMGLRRLRRLEAEGEPFESPHLRRLVAQMDPRREVRFLTHTRAQAPCTWGARSPVVLLPRSAESWDDADLRDVIVHELAHVERWDWLSNQVARGICALFFFQPLVWWASARMAREAELACDDRVLRLGASAPDYAERLVGFARRAGAAGAALQMARSGDLSLRIAAILDPKLRRKAMTRLNIFVVLAAALLLVVAIAPSHLVHAEAGQAELRGSRAEAPLLDAAQAGDLGRMTQLIADGESVNVGVRGEGTPLIQAAMGGHREAVELLLKAGADVNLTELAGPRYIPRTPLGAAAVSGDPAIAEMMLAAGAALEEAPRGEASPLMIAARTGQLEMVEVFLAAGADADRAIHGDGSALIRAVAGGNPAVVARLLEAGADPNRGVRGDGSPLIQAASRGDAQSVKLLLDAGADPNKGVRGDGTPLTAAGGNAEIVDLLVAAGAEVDGEIEGDGNPLIQAAGRGDRAMVERLLDAGADPNGAVRGDGNPLIRASSAGHTEIVTLLLDRGAAIDRVVPGDENALIQASGAGQLETVELLIARGADVNQKVRVKTWGGLGFENRTPLSMARKGGHDSVVDLLVRSGARD